MFKIPKIINSRWHRYCINKKDFLCSSLFW